MMRLLRQVFGIDERSLALMRIALALVLLIDLAIRATALTAHYTDAGILPRAAQIELYDTGWVWSLHMLSGTALYQGVMMLIAAGAAIGMLVGYRTRLMTILSWVMLVSLHARNPAVLNSGDSLIRMLMLWAMFLPLGRRASIDSLRQPEVTAPPAARPHLSAASAALLIQVLLVYIVSGIFKLYGPWPTGDAMQIVFQMDLYTRPLASRLLAYPTLLTWASHLTPWLEIALPLATLLPVFTQRVRLMVLAAVVLFHAGVELTLHVGMFSLFALAGWTAFVPPIFWDFCARHIRADRLRERIAAWLPPATPRGALVRGGWAGNIAAGLLLLYVLVWNVQVFRLPLTAVNIMPLGLTPISQILSLDQRWIMFSTPGLIDGWYILIGEYRDGSRIDLLANEPFDPLTVSKPDSFASQIPNDRWRKYFQNLCEPRNEALRAHVAGPICETWGRDTPDNPLVHLEVIFIEEKRDPQNPLAAPTLRQRSFYRGICPEPSDVHFPRPHPVGGL